MSTDASVETPSDRTAIVVERRVDECVLLPGLDIAVEVVSVRDRRVRLRFTTPRTVLVIREELQKES